MKSISVETSKNVQIHYTYPSLGIRIGAYLIDAILVWSVIIFFILISNPFNLTSSSEQFYLLLPAILLYFFYHLVLEYANNGQSIGKMALGIKVARLDGEPPTLSDYLQRWILRLLDIGSSNGLVAIISIAITEKKQRLGDILAGTTVIKVHNKRVNFISDSIDENDIKNGEIIYPQVDELTDTDVRKIESMLRTIKASSYSREAKIKMLIQLKSATEKKMNIPPVSQESHDFLRQVVLDYKRIRLRESAMDKENI